MKALRKILGENIWLKISFFNAFAVFSKVLSSWVINKVIAVYVGPQGTALSEQLRNFLQTAQGFAGLGINEGVTRYTAEYQENNKRLSGFLTSVYKIVIIASLIFSLLIIVFSAYINQLLFGAKDFQSLIILSGILLPFFAGNVILLSVLNGFQAYKKVTYINIWGNIASAILAVILVINAQLYGALLTVLLAQLSSFFISLYFTRDYWTRIFRFSSEGNSKNHFKRLQSYILMAMVTALVIPVFSILIRNTIIDYFENGQIQAGYWDAVRKISTLFLAFIMPVFSLYYFPKLAKINTNKEFKLEIAKFSKQILPLFSIGLFLLYLLRHFATYLFFSPEYYPMENLFAWQLAGDFVRVLSLSIAYLMLARAHVVKYIVTEIGFWILYYFSTLYFINLSGIKGVVIAYFVTYVVYLLVLIIMYRKILFSRKVISL